MSLNTTAYGVWRDLQNLFQDNQPSRIIHLEAELHRAVQGDMTVSAFYQRLKTLADALGDLDNPISDRTLVLTLLRGLSDKFSVQVSMILLLRPFPTFPEARSILLLEELNQVTKSSNPTALISTSKPPVISSSGSGTRGNNNYNGNRAPNSWNGNKKGKTKGYNNNRGPSAPSTNWRPPWGMILLLSKLLAMASAVQFLRSTTLFCCGVYDMVMCRAMPSPSHSASNSYDVNSPPRFVMRIFNFFSVSFFLRALNFLKAPSA